MLILGLLEKNRLLRCFVTNFIADGFTRFFVLISSDKKCAHANFYAFCMSAQMFGTNIRIE